LPIFVAKTINLEKGKRRCGLKKLPVISRPADVADIHEWLEVLRYGAKLFKLCGKSIDGPGVRFYSPLTVPMDIATVSMAKSDILRAEKHLVEMPNVPERPQVVGRLFV
jgi:hypothetical protein